MTMAPAHPAEVGSNGRRVPLAERIMLRPVEAAALLGITDHDLLHLWLL